MLLSIDWDAFSGTREFVFDSPIWGTPDREADKMTAWQQRALKRGGTDWQALAQDFPLYDGWQNIKKYKGVPSWVSLGHEDAWHWLRLFPKDTVLNIDSHHDLLSLSGDATRLRAGNWAGLALGAGLIDQYICQYPDWHSALPVAEGYDIARTQSEISELLDKNTLEHVRLERGIIWPHKSSVSGILLVQSPSWTNPEHDVVFCKLLEHLSAKTINAPMIRSLYPALE